ncbi:hypothetical protein AB0K16_57325 [Nonomuraea jabiensis]
MIDLRHAHLMASDIDATIAFGVTASAPERSTTTSSPAPATSS